MGQEFINSISTWGLPVLLIGGMVLLMWLPNRKRKKQYQQLMESLQPGKLVKTIGGIYGKIVAVKEDLVTIEVMPDKTRIVFAKGAIATVEDAETEEKTMDSK
jgi:preprotein translocase subunit YajC